MAKGTERRETVGSRLAGGAEIAPAVAPAARGGLNPAQSSGIGSIAELGALFGEFASDTLREVADVQNARSLMDGQIAQQQGQTFDQLETGGDKFALEGYRIMEAQTIASEMASSQENLIRLRAHEDSPEAFRQQYVDELEMQIDGLDPRTAQLVQDNMTKLMPDLVQKHTAANMRWKEQKVYDAAGQGVAVMSSRPGMEQDVMSIMRGDAGSPSAALSEERRYAAVADGIIAGLSGGDPNSLLLAQESGVWDEAGMMKHHAAVNRALGAYSSQMDKLREQSFLAQQADADLAVFDAGFGHRMRDLEYAPGRVLKAGDRRKAVVEKVIERAIQDGASNTDLAVELKEGGLADYAEVPAWKAALSAGLSRINTETGEVPEEGEQALKLFMSLNAAPALRRRHVGGEENLAMLRMAEALHTIRGWGMSSALLHARKAQERREDKGVSVGIARREMNEAFDELSTHAEWWQVLGGDKTANMGYVRDNVTLIARSMAGLSNMTNPAEIVAEATKIFAENHIFVRGAWINTRNRDMPSNIVPALEAALDAEEELSGAKEGSLSLIPVRGRTDYWQLVDATGLPVDGEVRVITGDAIMQNYLDLQEAERQAAQQEVEESQRKRREAAEERKKPGGMKFQADKPDTSAAPDPARRQNFADALEETRLEAERKRSAAEEERRKPGGMKLQADKPDTSAAPAPSRRGRRLQP